MQKQILLTVLLTREQIERLRQEARKRGLVCKRGLAASLRQGSIGALIGQIADGLPPAE
jgi:hypothetical protein